MKASRTPNDEQNMISQTRRKFLRLSTSTAVLASAGIGPVSHALGSPASPVPPRTIAFSKDEYHDRWDRVQKAMAAAGSETLIVWQRSASAYDKVGDVFWLTNFFTNGTGQDPYSEELDEQWAFAAALIRKGREPELHIGSIDGSYDAKNVVCGKIVSHLTHMTEGIADYLSAERIQGKVIVVGDDVLPGKFDRILRRKLPQIDWVPMETFLEGPQMIKSPMELEVYRAAGALVSDALGRAMAAMIAGKRACEAAAAAADTLMRAGGGFHRISIAHGPTMPSPLSIDFYGYDNQAPAPGDLFAVWIYGPIFNGYWLDPGRTALCGRQASTEKKQMVEDCATLVDQMVKVVRPGMQATDLADRWAEIGRKNRFFDPSLGDELFGHCLGTGFPAAVLPMGASEIGPMGYRSLKGSLKPGMVLAAEAFLKRPGLGSAGFENNFIVTGSGAEVLDRTPMLFD